MGVRAFYYRRAQQEGGPAEYREERLTRLRRILGLPFPIILLAYMIYPPLFSWAAFPLPLWARWIGVLLSVVSLLLIVWVQWALDLNFSHILHLRAEHTLVEHGPYRWVRHPMYTTHFIHGISIVLLTSSWLVGGLYLVAFSLIVLARLHKEEQAMLEKFGGAYRQYMRRTGRFLPRLRPGHD